MFKALLDVSVRDTEAPISGVFESKIEQDIRRRGSGVYVSIINSLLCIISFISNDLITLRDSKVLIP